MNFNTTKSVIVETTKTASTAIMNESIDVAKINVGKLVYNNVKILLAAYIPQPTWYQKLFISKDKRELAELIAVYGMLHIIKTKYSHYVIDAVTSYINLELQTKLVGSINVRDLENVFKLPTKN